MNKATVQFAFGAEDLPDQWLTGDDKCDCTFQRIGAWYNPYIGRMLQVRLCCIWAAIYKEYPEFVQELPFFWTENQVAPVMSAQPWDSEDMDMPLDIWYRQLASETGRPLADVRAEYSQKQHLRPRKVKRGTGKESRQPDTHAVRMTILDRLEKTGWRREDRIALWEREDKERSDAKGR